MGGPLPFKVKNHEHDPHMVRGLLLGRPKTSEKNKKKLKKAKRVRLRSQLTSDICEGNFHKRIWI